MLNGTTMMHKPTPRKAAQEGVVLIEAMVAILIFSIGVLAIVGLQASMIKNTSEAKYRSEASYIANSRIGLMWASGLDNSTAPTLAANFVENNTDISNLLPGGRRTTAQPDPANQPMMFTVTVTWLVPGPNQTTHNFTTLARINGG
jgi:type IV pilus assembly protein PilV